MRDFLRHPIMLILAGLGLVSPIGTSAFAATEAAFTIDFSAESIITLDSHLRFFENRTFEELKDADPGDAGKLVKIPHTWDSPQGFGTYHIVLRNIAGQDFALAMGVPFSVYRVTLKTDENIFQYSQGTFGRSPDTCIPQMKPALISLPKTEVEKADLFIEVCNYRNIKAGLRKPVTFGLRDPLAYHFYKGDFFKFGVLGIVITLSVFYATMTILSITRRESTILLSVCIAGMLRILCTNSYLENILSFLDRPLVFELRYKMEYLLFMAPAYGFVAMVYYYFPRRSIKILSYVTGILVSPLAFVTVVSDYISWGRFAHFYHLHLVICILATLYFSLSAAIRNEKYAILNFLAALLPGVSFPYDMLVSQGLIGGGYMFDYAFALFLMLHTVIFVVRYKDISKSNMHAYRQLTKVVYPHQIAQIKAGMDLEKTMPTEPSEACVLSFDIIGSTKIRHEKSKDFYRNLFRKCNEIMMEDYDGANLRASAYRIKEMGDGFLCSIGYPFKSRTGFIANDTLEIAYKFFDVLQKEASLIQANEPICCGIGIAFDHIVGFYPDSGTKEYDLYGRAIVLATRYESMRKELLKNRKPRSMLILQDRVYISLAPELRAQFTKMDLKEAGLLVRDDPAASELYYRFLESPAEEHPDPKIVFTQFG